MGLLEKIETFVSNSDVREVKTKKGKLSVFLNTVLITSALTAFGISAYFAQKNAESVPWRYDTTTQESSNISEEFNIFENVPQEYKLLFVKDRIKAFAEENISYIVEFGTNYVREKNEELRLSYEKSIEGIISYFGMDDLDESFALKDYNSTVVITKGNAKLLINND